MAQKVLVDANVLASKTVLDWLYHLQQHNLGMYSLVATNDILFETFRVLRRRNPDAGSEIVERRVKLVGAILDDAELKFSGGLEFTGNDVDDYHVHAAAVSNGVHILLTFNDASDFTSSPESENYEIYKPDDFFDLVIQSNPDCLYSAVKGHFEYWRGARNPKSLSSALENAGCPEFASTVKRTLAKLHQHNLI